MQISLRNDSTARLTFESLKASHAAKLSDALMEPSVYAHISRACPKTISELAAEFARVSAGPPVDRIGEIWWNFAVRLHTGEYIGRVQATIHDGLAEVAYMFGSLYWGHGYATEAVHWLHGRITESQLATSLWATVNPDNSRSARLLERLEYQRVSQGLPLLFSYEQGDVVYIRQMSV